MHPSDSCSVHRIDHRMEFFQVKSLITSNILHSRGYSHLQVQNAHILDHLMNIEYLASSLEQQRQFSTVLLSNTIAEIGDLSGLSQNNLTQFIVGLVDKLWLGLYTAPGITVVNFVSNVLLSSQGVRNYDILRSMGRSVLFVLSRDCELQEKLQCLHLLISNEALLHLDAEILAALTYSLAQFAQQCPLPMETVRPAPWISCSRKKTGTREVFKRKRKENTERI